MPRIIFSYDDSLILADAQYIAQNPAMRYLHTMLRASNLDATLDFFINKLGLIEVNRYDDQAGRYTLVFLAAPGQSEAQIEVTHNWDKGGYEGGPNFGHVAYEVDDIYAKCQDLLDKGVTIVRPPRDGAIAFIKSPDGISIELIQRAFKALPKQEPWASMPNGATSW
jgi:lactoylglutathione lyase